MTDRKIASSKVVDFAGVRVTHQSPLSLDRCCRTLRAIRFFLEISMTQSTVTSRTIAVDHIKIESGKTFEEVRRALEETIPKLNPGVREFLRKGDQERANAEEEYRPKLSIFLDRDHGALLQIAGGTRNARQYEIGNPLTASKMTRHQLPAALYAPLRVVLYEDGNGRGIFEYDKPSSFFGQFGDGRVTEVGHYLDETLEVALLRAAG
jgi:Domain of unknown function DUF302